MFKEYLNVVKLKIRTWKISQPRCNVEEERFYRGPSAGTVPAEVSAYALLSFSD